MQWFAQIQGQVYGPYNDAQMQSYVSEGRITPNSMISNNPPSGFFPAAGYDVFNLWAGTGQAIVQPISSPQQAPQTHYQDPQYTDLLQPDVQYTQAEYQETGTGGGVTPLARPNRSSFQSFQPETEAAQNIFMIMAEIRSEGAMGFLTKIQEFGHVERIGDSLWLLKSSANAEALRNALSQTLSRQDRLFIINSTQNKTAWFNIGADLDHRIRTLWEDQS